MKEAEIKYCSDGTRGNIVVDGVDMSRHVSLVSISHQAGESPKAVLGLAPRSVEVQGRMRMTVDIYNLPESVRLELYEALKSQYESQGEITAFGDDSRRFGKGCRV